MTLHLHLYNLDDCRHIADTTIDTTTRKTLDLTIDPADLETTFIALNALLGTLEAHLHLQHLNKPAA